MKQKLAIVIAVLAASTAFAARDGTLKLNDSYGYDGGKGNGGEFQATPMSGFVGVTGLAGDRSSNTFKTFCLERSEFISFNTEYGAIINTKAIKGGNQNYDDLSKQTAYLYYSFRTKALTGYDYGSNEDNNSNINRDDSGTALQLAIWTLENEISDFNGVNQKLKDLANQFIAFANNTTWTDIGNVRVLNMYEKGHEGDMNYLKQDQLTIIPVPAAALLGALGLACSFGVRRVCA